MAQRELVVLGTASQAPTRYRNHNGYLLRWDGYGVLFDPGEGTQRQMALAGMASSAIDKICITHLHGDHCLGLPERLEAAGIRGADIGRLQREGRIETPQGTVRVEDVSVERRGQVMAFVMDTRPCDAAVELARDADLLVCESTFLSGDEALARDYGHMTARQAATVAREAGARRVVLTHFSQRYPDEADFLSEAAEIVDDVVAARDLDVIAMPPRVPA